MTRKNNNPGDSLPAVPGISTDNRAAPKRATEPHNAVTMRADGRRAYPLETGRPEALVIHCADSRFQPAFRQFLRDELGITRYFPIIIGGGIHAFGLQQLLPKNFKILWQQIKFVLEVAKPAQVIIINHEDCLWYNHMKGYHPSIAPKEKGRLDLRAAAERLIEDFAGIEVRTFWAAIDNNTVVFSES